MALICCPECNREISDKATSCPHCGFPLNKNIENKYDIILTRVNNKSIIKTIGYIRQITGWDVSQASNLIHALPQKLFTNISYENAQEVQNYMITLGNSIEIAESNNPNNTDDDFRISQYRSIANAPIKCPRCGSTAITSGQRGFNLITGFIGSNKTVNRCGRCGWSWKP